MANPKHLFVPVAALLLAACSQGGSKPADTTKGTSGASSQPASRSSAEGSQKGLSARERDARDDDGVVRRGLPLSEAPALTVSEVHAQVTDLKGKSVKVTGEVTQVCSKSGCWFSLRDGGKSMRITSKDYKYFVPRDAVGMTAVVEGELSAKMLDQKTAQHYADDLAEATGEPAKKVEGPVYEVAIASVGLEMKK